MKIAVPTRGNEVDSHFGHCEKYTIISVGENNSIQKIESLDSPVGCGCKSNIASVLANMGVKVMLAGNMGEGAVNVLRNNGIQVFRGNAGDVRQLAEAFLANRVKDSGESCSHHHDHAHQDGHSCNHNH